MIITYLMFSSSRFYCQVWDHIFFLSVYLVFLELLISVVEHITLYFQLNEI